MPRPLIGITSRNGTDSDRHLTTVLLHAYINAVTDAGGVPVPIPVHLSEEILHDLYTKLDGILFSGGGDIALDRFNGQPHPRVYGIDAGRDFTELTLLRRAVEDGKAFLGICRGAQLVNVGLGGTLYTHIRDQFPNALDHDYPGDLRRQIVHPVRIEEGSRAAEVFGQTHLNVNSLHHQGLKDIAPSLRAAGYSPDGLVEVVELPGHPYALAVQWHPEWLTDQPAMQRLFSSLIEAARKQPVMS